MSTKLITYLHSFGFEEDELQHVTNYFSFEKKSKKEFLIMEGNSCTDFFFIVEGYARTFHITDSGEEITTDILKSNDLACSMYSLLKRSASFENIQCITDCSIYKISEKNFEILAADNPKWLVLSMKFFKAALLKKEERILAFAKLKAHQRYQQLLLDSPDIVQNIPVQYIASYIGVKPESLSRIRGQETIS